MAEEEPSVPLPTEEEEETLNPVTTDLKRKLEESDDDKSSLLVVDLPTEESNDLNSLPDAKKPRLEQEFDEPALTSEPDVVKLEVSVDAETVISANNEVEKVENVKEVENTCTGEVLEVEADDVKHVTVDNTLVEKEENQTAEIPCVGDVRESSDEILKTNDSLNRSTDLLQPVTENQYMTRKIEVPTNKVGVLIGKSGDTIRFLQLNSGAKIQILRDSEVDPYALSRPVELSGSLESINKAEMLIKDVITEADGRGSPSLVAKGFGTVQGSGIADHIEFHVPNEKVGLIIGKGGETIKNLQIRSRTRIQLIPQHLPEGDQSTERTVRVTGDKNQTEMARNLIIEVMNQIVRSSPLSGGSNQQGQPRGQWGPCGSPAQARGYDKPQQQQRGGYPSQNPQFMAPPYGCYPPQQLDPRSNFNGSSRGGYAQGPDYGHPQSAPSHQNYGHANQGNSQPYSQEVANHSGYAQQSYSMPPTYGMPSQGPQSYAPYQNPSQHYPHTSGGPAQPPPSYPYNSAPPANDVYSQSSSHPTPGPIYGQPGGGQVAPVYSQSGGQVAPSYAQPGGQMSQNFGQPGGTVAPGYGQPGVQAAPGYGQHSGQVAGPGYSQPAPNYGQPGQGAAPGYVQPGGQVATGGYGSYPGYAEQQQPAPNAVPYGGYQQGSSDASYPPTTAAPVPAYNAPPTSNQAAMYEQPTPQYASAPVYATQQVYGGQH